MSVDAAAAILAVSPVMLRRLLERASRRGPDGLIEAAIDGGIVAAEGRAPVEGPPRRRLERRIVTRVEAASSVAIDRWR